MICLLHTVVPLDAVFPGDPPGTELVPLGGSFVEGTRGKDGIQITRLISTDPAMYLDKRYQIGQSIRSDVIGRGTK